MPILWETNVDDDRDLGPFRFDDEPPAQDKAAKCAGHVASSRGIQLAAVDGRLHSAPCAVTTTGWFFHAFVALPTEGSAQIDSGPERPIPHLAFFRPGLPIKWNIGSFAAAVCQFEPSFMAALTEAEPHLRLDALDVVLGKESKRLTYLAQQIFRESLSPGFGATLFAEAAGLEIALEIVRCDRALALEAAPLRGGLAPWQMRRLESYVGEHLSDELSLQSLAALLGMSPRHLSRVVKHDKGVGVHRWVAEQRLTEARRLLAQTGLPLHEIAQRTAFKSPGAFSTAFRAACGLSPSEYRRLTLR